MTRYEIKDDDSPISVAYGSDEMATTGTFLAVTDTRLEWDENASDEVNAVTEKIGIKDGGGSYFDLHTGNIGFGLKVSSAVMRVFLTRYGVSQDMADFVLLETFLMSVSRPQDCNKCKLEAGKNCAKCKTKRYCSRECQIKDWPLHKHICESLPFPPKTVPSSVYCFYLPEDGDKIQVVQVELTQCLDPVSRKNYAKPVLRQYLGTEDSSEPVKMYNRKKRHYTVNLKIMTRRNNSGCASNKLVKKLTGKENWKGPLVVMKLAEAVKEGINSREFLRFINVEIDDFDSAVDVLSGGLIQDADDRFLLSV
jgi:hypothetical protein